MEPISVLDEFCVEYHTLNSISPSRARQQEKELMRFEEFIASRGKVRLVDADGRDLKAYMDWLILDKGFKPATVVTARNMIRPFYKWAWEKGYVTADVVLQMRLVRAPRGFTRQATPRPYTRGELKIFWKALDKRWPHKTELSIQRYRNGTSQYRRVWRHAMRVQVECIVALALQGGLRRTEIFTLTPRDLNPDNAYIPVLGKSDPTTGRVKHREIPMTNDLRAKIEEWLRWRRWIEKEFGKIKYDSLWIQTQPYRVGRPMTKNRYKALLGQIKAGYTFHRFRHTCATEWLRSGVEIYKVQRLLGHSSLEETLLYVQLLKGDIEVSMLRFEGDFLRSVRPEDEPEDGDDDEEAQAA